jgi:hypothetical protein
MTVKQIVRDDKQQLVEVTEFSLGQSRDRDIAGVIAQGHAHEFDCVCAPGPQLWLACSGTEIRQGGPPGPTRPLGVGRELGANGRKPSDQRLIGRIFAVYKVYKLSIIFTVISGQTCVSSTARVDSTFATSAVLTGSVLKLLGHYLLTIIG